MAGYIGSKASVVSSGAENKKVFTATAGQTSFTGLTYSPNRVHVFQNGVRLVDGTDYTATNGTSLTLTVGAATDDQVVVVSYSSFQTSDTVSASAGGTFLGDVNFTGAFTSQGIDDNATSTAMTLDASGNLLVGKATTGITDAGFSILGGSNDGTLEIRRNLGTANASAVGYISRGSTDGNILQFYKDTTHVGSIGTTSSDLYIGTGNTTIRFADGVNGVIPTGTNGAQRDGAVNLGAASNRFQHLYLSGGVVFSDAGGSGTSSSNSLDSYEEGTWQPVAADNSSGGNTSTTGQGFYTKIGRLVVATCDITNINTTGLSSGNSFFVQGLPFANNGTVRSTATLQVNLVNKGDGLFAHLSENGTSFTFKYNDDSKNNAASGLLVSDIKDDQADMFGITLVYHTAT